MNEYLKESWVNLDEVTAQLSVSKDSRWVTSRTQGPQELNASTSTW